MHQTCGPFMCRGDLAGRRPATCERHHDPPNLIQIVWSEKHINACMHRVILHTRLLSPAVARRKSRCATVRLSVPHQRKAFAYKVSRATPPGERPSSGRQMKQPWRSIAWCPVQFVLQESERPRAVPPKAQTPMNAQVPYCIHGKCRLKRHLARAAGDGAPKEQPAGACRRRISQVPGTGGAATRGSGLGCLPSAGRPTHGPCLERSIASRISPCV